MGAFRADAAVDLSNPRLRVHVHPDVVGQQLGDDMVLVNIESGWVYELDHTGAKIWAYLQSGAALSGLLSSLEAEYGAATTERAAEVTEFIDLLVSERLIWVQTDAC